MKTYILKISKLLERKKITKNELSQMIGKNKNTLSNYFTEKTKIDIDTFIKIAEVLEVPVSYFFDEVGAGANVNNGNISNSVIGTNGSKINYQNECKNLQKENENLKERLKEKDALIESKNEIIELLKNK